MLHNPYLAFVMLLIPFFPEQPYLKSVVFHKFLIYLQPKPNSFHVYNTVCGLLSKDNVAKDRIVESVEFKSKYISALLIKNICYF